MKMKRLTLAVVGMAILGALALAQPSAASEGVEQSATGSGHYTVGGELRTFAFSATKRADGSVQGEYQLHSRVGAGAIVHVSVTCLAVVGNQAWVGGIITHSTNPTIIEGSISYFRTLDNDANGTPDQLSPARLNDVAGEDIRFCTERPTGLPLNNIEQGNVTVRE